MNIKQGIACIFMTAGAAHGFLTTHYGLVSKDFNIECQDKLESYNGTINTNVRAATGWFKGMLGNEETTDNVPEDIQECLDPSILSQTSYFWGTTFMEPVINKGNEWFNPEDKSLTQKATEGAREVLDDTSEGVSSRYERSKNWIADQWNSLRGAEEDDENETEVEQPFTIPAPTITEEPTNAPEFDENGDVIEQESPSWRERTKDTFDGIDWTPWN